MDLTVVLARLALEEKVSSSKRIQISGNAEGVGTMRLGQAKNNALVLRQIAVGVLDRQFRVRLAYAVKQRPAHDAHEGFRPERLTGECQDFCVWGGYSRGSPTRLPFVFCDAVCQT